MLLGKRFVFGVSAFEGHLPGKMKPAFYDGPVSEMLLV
jgi:hypothetical protein